MRGLYENEELTPKEQSIYQHERQMYELQADHQKEIKRMDIELAKLEAKWSSWLSIPKTIITLPVLFLFGIAYCITVATKQEPSQNFWDFLKR